MDTENEPLAGVNRRLDSERRRLEDFRRGLMRTRVERVSRRRRPSTIMTSQPPRFVALSAVAVAAGLLVAVLLGAT